MKAKDQKSKQVDADGRTKIHNVRFYNLAPRSIQCLAYNKVFHKLALSRNDGSIEIWDMHHAPCLEKTLPNHRSPGNSVEGIVWAGERLFTVGLSGQLVEWDLQTLQQRRAQYVTGDAIWCVDVNAEGTELAVGTEQGYINIFDIADDQMQYTNLFDKQEGRVLCCKYDRSGEHLVTGSSGAIRIWDVRSGHALHKMTVERTDMKKDVIVWSLQVLSDFTIVSGDSRGQVTVWDGRSASQIESHQVLAADVLAVAVNEEENLLMCSGIEPLIRIYAKTEIKREDMVFHPWVKFLQRSVHDHDVKTLLCVGDRILSGGMDGYLGVSSASKTSSQKISKFGPFLQNHCAVVASAKKLILLRYTNYLEIWRLGSTSGKLDCKLQNTTEETEDGSEDHTVADHQRRTPKRNVLALDEAPEKLLEFKSKDEEFIVCATLSPDGKWLCYSTQTEIRLFRFVPAVAGKNATQLCRVRDLPEQLCTASHLQFTSDSKRLFVVNATTKQILIFSVSPSSSSDLDFVDCFEAGKHIKDSIHIFSVSQCGSYVVAAGVDHTISVWCLLKGKSFQHHLNLPRYSAATTALAIHAHQTRLVAAFSDGKIFEYDFEEMCFTCSEHEFFVEDGQAHCVTSIVLDERNPDIFILQNDSNLFVLEKCSASSKAGLNTDSDKSLKKPKRILADTKLSGLRLKFQRSFMHFNHLSWLSLDELVAVGVNPISLIEQLPGAFKQKKFGVA